MMESQPSLTCCCWRSPSSWTFKKDPIVPGANSDPICWAQNRQVGMDQTTLIRFIAGALAILSLAFLIYRRRTKVN